MDIRFLKDISEAYVMDRGLELKYRDTIFQELYDLTGYLRQCDTDLYEELYALNRLSQQKILSEYLDLTAASFSEEEEVLSEQDIVQIALSAKAIYGILAFLAAIFFRRSITKGMFKTFATIGRVFEAIGKFVTKRSRYLRLRYAIIQQNFEKCYKKCGIRDMREISVFAYTSIRTGSTWGTKRSSEQAGCLRDCYLECLIEIICLHMESYFACLKRTGAYAAVEKSGMDELLKMISSTNLSVACSDHYDLAKQAFDRFYDVLDFVFNRPQDESLKMSWMQKLRAKLYDVREEIRKTDINTLNQRYGQQQQQNTPRGEGSKNISPAPNTNQ